MGIKKRPPRKINNRPIKFQHFNFVSRLIWTLSIFILDYAKNNSQDIEK